MITTSTPHLMLLVELNNPPITKQSYRMTQIDIVLPIIGFEIAPEFSLY